MSMGDLNLKLPSPAFLQPRISNKAVRDLILSYLQLTFSQRRITLNSVGVTFSTSAEAWITAWFAD